MSHEIYPRGRPPTLSHTLGLLALCTGLALGVAGCASRASLQAPGPGNAPPHLTPFHVVAEDGYRLPLRHWPADGDPRAVALAVHGFNDHGGSFEVLAKALAPHGIRLYAHDQRGFGTTAQRRLWPGHERLVQDVELLVELLQERYPDTPLYLIGKSMGAAVVILTMTGDTPPPVDGSVLIAPATWGQTAMPWYQRLGLWLGVRLFPSVSFSVQAARQLGIEPTDDPEIRRMLAEDPLILRRARMDTLHGVTDLMDRALQAAPHLPGPALILYGDEDQVIPPEAFCALLERLPGAQAPEEEPPWRLALYPGGYHMLTRYSGREQVEADIAAWLLDTRGALPSGHETRRDEARQALCR